MEFLFKLTDENSESEEVNFKNDDMNDNPDVTQNEIVNEENQKVLQPDMKNLL